MRPIFRFSILIALLVTAAACTPATPTPPTALTPITIQLSWISEYSSAPFHVAARDGDFAGHGLDVTLLEGGFGEQGYIDPVTQVVEGNADFAIQDGSSLIQARAAGIPVVGIAAIFQRNPLAIISLRESGIATPQDLVGRTISVASGGAENSLVSLLRSQGIALDSVTLVERTDFGVDPLVNGEVDALVAWVNNEGVSLQEQGLDPQFILMTDYGVDSYNLVLFTTETMITEKPEVVRGVVEALQEGIGDVIENPAQAIDYTLSFNPDLVREEQLRRLEASIPLINVPGIAHGAMEADVWQFIYDLLIEQGLLTEPIDLSTVYTLEFISTDGQ